MQTSNKKIKKKAFTLVELIIVITILAILATIAFVSFQNYTKDARDANRISTLKNIEKGLSLYSIKSNTYPEPEEYIEIIGTGNILLSKQGIIGKEVAQKINLNKETLDPKDKTNYIYSITGNGKKFQLGAYLEDGKYISYFPQILKTYANIDYTNRYFYTIGHKVGIFLEDGTSNPILKTQSLTGINLETNTDNFKVVFSNDTQSGITTSSGTNLIETIKENQKTTPTIKAPNNCLFDGRIILSGQSVQAYKTASVPHGNTCNQETRTCNDSILSGSFTFPDCNIEGLTCGVDEYSENGTTCVPVGTGYYSANGDTNRTECSNKPENSIYTNSGNGTNNCSFTCNTSEGYSGPNCENREVYGDEDANAIAACNKWVELAIGSSAGGYQNWLWVPLNPTKNGNFTTDGTGTPLTDDFYKRTLTHNGINYTCKGFAVMKYEAKFNSTSGKTQSNNTTRNTWARASGLTTSSTSDTFGENLTNNVVSKPQDHPIARLTQGEAIDACSGLSHNGKQSHLITNNEWMAIARNIEAKKENWTGGEVGIGGIYRGNVNLTDTMSYSSYQKVGFTKYTEPAGNDTDARGTNAIGNRRLILSNDSNIWDLSGNVWEHVNKSNLPTTLNLRATNTWNNITTRPSNACNQTTSAWYSYYNNDGVAYCDFKNGYSYANIGPATINLNANNGIGRIWSRSNTDTTNQANIFLRGGAGGGEAIVGVFTMHLFRGAADQAHNFGFRCSL